MKIALSFAGYFNSQRDKSSFGEDAFTYVFDNILRGNDVDIFIHSWDTKNRDIVLRLYEKWIVESKFENQIDFRPIYFRNQLNLYPKRNGATDFWNVFSQLYSVQESMKLIPKENDYDVVIKSRFDIGRINLSTINQTKYKVQLIKFNPNLNMDKFYMARWKDETLKDEGPADVWFYSSFENMRKLSIIYDILKKDAKANSEYTKWCGTSHGGPINTAKAWKWVLIKTGLWDKKILL